eukprot:gene3929-biopygen1015
MQKCSRVRPNRWPGPVSFPDVLLYPTRWILHIFPTHWIANAFPTRWIPNTLDSQRVGFATRWEHVENPTRWKRVEEPTRCKRFENPTRWKSHALDTFRVTQLILGGLGTLTVLKSVRCVQVHTVSPLPVHSAVQPALEKRSLVVSHHEHDGGSVPAAKCSPQHREHPTKMYTCGPSSTTTPSAGAHGLPVGLNVGLPVEFPAPTRGLLDSEEEVAGLLASGEFEGVPVAAGTWVDGGVDGACVAQGGLSG